MSIEKLIGMEARQAIQAGDVVFTDQVQAPIVGQARRGDHSCFAKRRHPRRTTARARQDGARGELVQVESLETKERFDARVVGPARSGRFLRRVSASVRTAGQRKSKPPGDELTDSIITQTSTTSTANRHD